MVSAALHILLALLTLSSAAVHRQERSTSVFGCSNTEITDSDRKKFLGYHNEARLRVAQGIEPNKDGLMNGAKNMYKLQWDCDLENEAQAAITECPSALISSLGKGQNLIRWSSSDGFNEPHALINFTLNRWWNVGKTYGVGPENRYDDGYLYTFANMVYSKTTKIGCAYKICGSYLTMTCLYNAIAYYVNQTMWETGTACTIADECTTYPGSVCDGGLCSLGGSLPNVTEALVAITTTPATAAPGSDTICTDNSVMTNEARKAFLDEHNKLRSRLALGLEDDPLIGKASKASRMLRMIYDCDVEASAMKHAQKCIFQHSPSTDRPNLGENLFMTSLTNYDKVKAGTQASQAWWSELKEYGVGEENILTMDVFNRGVGHYTQMAWENSYKLGCAVQHCDNMTLVVCQYGPAGNILNGLIYTKGEPCANCTTTCSTVEGLCSAA